MRQLLVPLFLLAIGLNGCIELKERRIEVTPGTVPAEIEGAHWKELPVSYCVVRDPQGGYVEHETFVSLAQRAMQAWAVPTAYEGECGGPPAEGNGRNEISWGDLAGDPNNLTEAGNTSLRYLTRPLDGPPEIVEADVTVHRDPARGKDTEECLYTTLLHEAGHILGLPHSTQDNVMSPVITDCLQAPTADDLAALESLYPVSQ